VGLLYVGADWQAASTARITTMTGASLRSTDGSSLRWIRQQDTPSGRTST
jgi:hypothetical protein